MYKANHLKVEQEKMVTWEINVAYLLFTIGWMLVMEDADLESKCLFPLPMICVAGS